jgi:hypothetical protein
MKDLAPLESHVLAMLLRGDDEVRRVLRLQAEELEVTSRKLTGVGFFTEFTVPSYVPRIPESPTLKFGNVNGSAENIKHGLGFLLYVADGALSMLEGYTYDDPWPEEIRGLVLSYAG